MWEVAGEGGDLYSFVPKLRGLALSCSTERGVFRVGPAGDAGNVAGDAVARRIHLCPSQESANEGWFWHFRVATGRANTKKPPPCRNTKVHHQPSITSRANTKTPPAGDAGNVAGDAVSKAQGWERGGFGTFVFPQGGWFFVLALLVMLGRLLVMRLARRRGGRGVKDPGIISA